MDSLLQPTLLLIILLVVLIVFGPGKLSDLGKGLRRAILDFRGQWGSLRGALLIAKGVDPAVGRDVGDMLPDEEAHRSGFWFLLLLALLIGNTLYLLLSPLLPAAARIKESGNSPLPLLVDLWLCIFAFGILNLLVWVHRHAKPKK